MDDVVMKEKRRFPRAIAKIKVTYTILNSVDATPYEFGETVTEDISEGGLCMLIKEQLLEDRLLYVNIQFATQKENLLMLGKTVSVERDTETGRNRARIKFVGMLPRGFGKLIASLKEN